MSNYIKSFNEFTELNNELNDDLFEFYAPNIDSMDPFWAKVKGLWAKFKGMFAKDEPPEYSPNQFKKGDEVQAKGRRREKVKAVSDKDKDRWIEVEDGDGHRRRMLYDTVALRKKRRVGEDFYDIENVYGQGYEQGRWKYDRKSAPGPKTGYGRTRSTWGYRSGSAPRQSYGSSSGKQHNPGPKPPVAVYKMPRKRGTP